MVAPGNGRLGRRGFGWGRAGAEASFQAWPSDPAVVSFRGLSPGLGFAARWTPSVGGLWPAAPRYIAAMLVALLLLQGCREKPVASARDSDATPADDTAVTVGGDDSAVYGDSDSAPAPSDRCLTLPRPTSDDALALTRIWPDLQFTLPTVLVAVPGGGWLVGEKAGTIWSIAEDGTASVALDLTDRVWSDGVEIGLLGMAVHPDYPHPAELFVTYARDHAGLETVVSRFVSTDGGQTFDAASEAEVLVSPRESPTHLGGHLRFGPDRTLFVGFGFSGPEGDTDAQDPWSWDGKLLRLDVDGGDPYAIPADNPFADGARGLPEVYALGFRNPWSFSFDEAGRLWLGDVGEFTYEEIDLVEAGGNYGWPIREGAHCYGAESCDTTGLVDPVAEYERAGLEGAIVVAFVGAGPALPDLARYLVFADAMTGRLGAVEADPELAPLTPIELVADSGLSLVSFERAEDGELRGVDIGGGGVYALRAPESVEPVDLPARLSETGCMDPADPSRPNAGLRAYSVNVPLWSDGAEKERWISLPVGATIDVGADGHWNFPVDTVLVKQFRLGEVLLETRLLVHHPDGWAGYTYAWDEAGTDATLIEGIESRTVDGQDWVFPSRSQCMRCHTEVAQRSLGPTTAQLNQGDQLDQLADLLSAPLPPDPPALPALDGPAPVEERAKALLDVNCAMCHQPGGTGGGGMDLRWTTPLAEMGVCDVAPAYGEVGIGDRLLAPGDPERSILVLRMRDRAGYRMPPVGTSEVDVDGVALVEAWIDSLTGCP